MPEKLENMRGFVWSLNRIFSPFSREMEDSSWTFRRIVSVSSSPVAAEKFCRRVGGVACAWWGPKRFGVPVVTMAVGFVMEMLFSGLCCRNPSQEQNTSAPLRARGVLGHQIQVNNNNSDVWAVGRNITWVLGPGTAITWTGRAAEIKLLQPKEHRLVFRQLQRGNIYELWRSEKSLSETVWRASLEVLPPAAHSWLPLQSCTASCKCHPKVKNRMSWSMELLSTKIQCQNTVSCSEGGHLLCLWVSLSLLREVELSWHVQNCLWWW